jgi:hypothetical protein
VRFPNWAMTAPFCSVTRPYGELSVVCPEQHVPLWTACERGWRALKLAAPSAESGISVFAIATDGTDYVGVRGCQLDLAGSVLSEHGHVVQW